MTITVPSVLLFCAMVCLLLATIGLTSPQRFQFFPAGMLFWAASLFLSVNVS